LFSMLSPLQSVECLVYSTKKRVDLVPSVLCLHAERRDIPSSQTEDKLYFFIEVPQGNDLSIVVRPKGLNTDQPKVEIKDMAWSDGPSELL